jgi:teichuronic acid biosynthesis glycosyltransferase TuaH
MILKDKVVIILGIAKFDGLFESTSYTVAKYLAINNQVYYVDYPYTWKDYLTRRDAAFIKRKNLFSRKSDGLLTTDIPGLKIVIVPPLLSKKPLQIGLLRQLVVFKLAMPFTSILLTSIIQTFKRC